MNGQAAALLMLKGAISDLPPEAQEKVKAAAERITEVVSQHGDEGKLALALVGLEFTAED